MPLKNSRKKKVVFLNAINSDIGIALAKRYSKKGYIVTGTYRSKKLLHELKALPDCHLFYCDLRKKKTIRDAIKQFSKLKLSWRTFISCVGWPKPLTAFFKGNFDQWSESIHVNALEPLRVLHGMYPFRDSRTVSTVVFFAGGGVNNAVINFSAYTASKIFLIKMCEFLDAENPDLNIFIVGPGWVRTKTHQLMLRDKNISKEKYAEITDFLKNNRGTKLEDIYACIDWLSRQGKTVSSGRNFSVVNDPWREGTSKGLAKRLKSDVNMFKLRRHQNHFSSKKRNYS